ncbi:MAG: UDP-N-acetylglucosamine 2-epimerase (non-hydrolyzing) [Bryobacteraceae bacterium]|nr:UDP-N-acetylglucosamine 2-epimerase (non-hydrolyzing) [Bryobacteraceae bacterium]
MEKILFILGTRPEAIKLCPLILHLQKHYGQFEAKVCATGQHRELLNGVLEAFGVVPDFNLEVMTAGQTLFQSTTRILGVLESVLKDTVPSMVIVQGDTTTTFCGALAAFYRGVPVGHVEAGLRTGDMRQPFPEEMNRVLTTRLTSLHFAATEGARQNLIREGVAESSIEITGNPGIDAVLQMKERLEKGLWQPAPDWPWLDNSRRLILVTAHRRESFGEGFEQICMALKRLAKREDVQIVYPVHPNPKVREAIERHLGSSSGVILLKPLDYVPFVDLMRRAAVLLTDSGGIQEEGPALGKPVLVMREKTERPEALEAGTAQLAGADADRIVESVIHLLDDPADYQRRSAVHYAYGDGRASERIAEGIQRYLKGG